MIGTVPLGYELCVICLGDVCLVESHRQRGQGLLERWRGQSDDCRRVDAPRQEGAKRHIAHQVQAHRLLEEHADGGHRRRSGWRRGLTSPFHRVAQVPVARWSESGSVYVSHVSHGKRVDVLHGREGSRDVSQFEEPAQGLRIRLGWHEPTPQEGTYLGGEYDPRAIVRRVERLDAEPVPSEKQSRVRRGFEKGESEHPAQTLNYAVTPGSPSMEQRFRVGVGPEGGRGAELGPQLPKVVDLAIEGDPLPGVARPHRHAAARRPVNDGQPTRPEHHSGAGSDSGICADVIWIKAFQEREDLRFPPDRAGHEKSPVVGPAVDLRIQHPQYRGHIVHGHPVTEFEDAGDPAHGGAATSARRAARMKEGALLCGDTARIEGAIPLDR